MNKVIVCQSSIEHLVLFFFSLSVAGEFLWLSVCRRLRRVFEGHVGCKPASEPAAERSDRDQVPRAAGNADTGGAVWVVQELRGWDAHERVCLWGFREVWGWCGEWFLLSVRLAQVCFIFWALSWTSVRTLMCTSSTFRRRVRRVRSKRWSASVERATATTPSASRAFSRYTREKPSSLMHSVQQNLFIYVTFTGAIVKHTILTEALIQMMSYGNTNNNTIKKTFSIRSHLHLILIKLTIYFHLLSFIKLIIIKETLTITYIYIFTFN